MLKRLIPVEKSHFWSLCLCASVLGVWLGWTNAAQKQAFLLEIDDAIGPASSDFIIRGINKAEAAGAEVVILRLNTPGGLDSAMRDIIKKILASTVPVVVYVAPSGSRAASAGTYILYASHVAAMAPATNIGAATPVELAPTGIGDRKPEKQNEGSTPRKKDSKKPGDNNNRDVDKTADNKEAPPSSTAMRRKVVNDAVAYIRGLAKMRGRNQEWAEQAVRQAESLTAEDALAKNVIDLIASDLKELLAELHGRSVKVSGSEHTFNTKDLSVQQITPDWRNKLLSIITNPNVASILMMLGIYGLFFELYNPGAVLPGVIGGICLLLALYAFQLLPVNYAGVALILLGIILFIAELFVPSFGALGIGGIVAFIIGSIILVDTDIEAFQISLPLVASVATITGGLMLTMAWIAVKQRRRPVVSGREQMLGDTGTVEQDFSGMGTILIHGEIWSAKTDRPLKKGQRVKVIAMDGLTLTVTPTQEINNV